MDTEPLQSPVNWISQLDITPWTDLQTGRTFVSSEPVRAIVGIEADNDPNGDKYWRMGYFYPVQLTQWAFAFAPHQPILTQFIEHIFEYVRDIARKHGGDLNSEETQRELKGIDPVNFTGPIAFTDSVSSWLKGKADLRWNAVTGLEDGGKSKYVEDVLVLPISGFRYVLSLFDFQLSGLDERDTNVHVVVPAGGGKETWARSRSRTRQHVCITTQRDRGGGSVSLSSMASSAAQSLVCVRIGPRFRMGGSSHN
jgi:hypothetical protein